jgi:hypothetical protein
METGSIIINTLDRVGMGKIKPSQNIIDESLSFNVRDLDLISDTELTKFIVGLSRHIIYIVLEINKLKNTKNNIRTRSSYRCRCICCKK